jgi:hypothetical protein
MKASSLSQTASLEHSTPPQLARSSLIETPLAISKFPLGSVMNCRLGEYGPGIRANVECKRNLIPVSSAYFLRPVLKGLGTTTASFTSRVRALIELREQPRANSLPFYKPSPFLSFCPHSNTDTLTRQSSHRRLASALAAIEVGKWLSRPSALI